MVHVAVREKHRCRPLEVQRRGQQGLRIPWSVERTAGIKDQTRAIRRSDLDAGAADLPSSAMNGQSECHAAKDNLDTAGRTILSSRSNSFK